MFQSIILNKDLSGSWLVSYFESKENRKNSSYADWVPLDEIAEINSGLYVSGYCDSRESGAAPYYRVDNVRDFVPNLTPVDLVHADTQKHKIPERCRVKQNDVVIARTGTLGKAFLATKHHSGAILSQHLTRLTLKSDLVSPQYLCSFLNSPLGREQLISFGSGSTRLELTHDNLKQLEVPIPKNVQVISSLSKNVDKAMKLHLAGVDKVDQAIRKLEDYLPKVLDSRLSGTLLNCELEELWTPRFLFHPAGEWEKKNLSSFTVSRFDDLAQIERGKGTRVSQYTKSGVPFIRTSSLINFSLDYFPDHFTDAETYEGFKQPIEDNDLIISMEGKIGAIAMLHSEWPIVFKNHIERARLYRNSAVGPEYIFALLNTKQYQAMIDRRVVVQATIPGMANRLRSLPIIVDAKKQKKIFTELKTEVTKLVQEGQKDRILAYELLKKARNTF